MVLKKSDLYSSLWKSCDELRGGMDASQYKDYILTLLFVKYVSDKAKVDANSLIDVPAGGSFDDMLAAKGDVEIGDRFNKIIAKLAEANGLRNVIDQADFNDEEKLGKGKEMQDRLSKLVTIFNDLDFRGSRAEGDDLLGDAYEYLMRHFATESGKSKGQFYTPAEVSRVVAKVVGINDKTRQDETVYDPACGSGSLLLKAAAEAPRGMTVYGQEKDNATWALSKMNMILHGNEIADIAKGDTITNPQFTKAGELRTFDYVVMNPPFSLKSWSNGLTDEYGRFDLGRPPAKNGDYAFLLHVLKSLKSTGRAAVILPHGVLFRPNAEASIRRELVRRGYIKGIIGLPGNLFYGTSIPACIVVLDKEDAQARTGIFMIDASKGYMKDGPKNRLRSQDIHKIVDVFTKQTAVDGYSRMVPTAEIADSKNDFNLNLSRYIDSSTPEDVQDLEAHLRGGIPEADIDALQAYWDTFKLLRDQLFEVNRPGYVDLAVDLADVQRQVLDSTEFRAYTDMVAGLVSIWFETHRDKLLGVTADTHPNDVIAEISEDLLARFKTVPILDEYDVYEQLMTYWHETMHDDLFLIMNEGWRGAAMPRAARVLGYDKNNKPKFEDAHIQTGSRSNLQRYVMDLLPPEPLIRRWFSDKETALEQLTIACEEAAQALAEYAEEHAVEDGLLWDAVDDSDKITQKSATAALREATSIEDDEAVDALKTVLRLLKQEAAAKKALKEAQASLDLQTLKKYGDLTEADVKAAVLDDKWLASLSGRIAGVVNDLSLVLVARIQQLGERYADTVADLDADLKDLEGRLASHLAEMGVA